MGIGGCTYYLPYVFVFPMEKVRAGNEISYGGGNNFASDGLSALLKIM